MKKYILFALLALAPAAFAQVSMQGTDFYLSFGSNVNYAVGVLNFQIRIVATQTASVTLTFEADNSTASFTVNAGQVYTYNLNETQRTNVYSNAAGISSKSLRIKSSAPVSVFALNQSYGTADATNVLPVGNLGTDYYQVSYKAMDAVRSDGYTVIATENNTTVYENGTQKATLNAGQVYSAYYPGTDATGRHITASKPIAYFVTNEAAMIPEKIIAADCLYQQMLPVNAWGNHFLVPVTQLGKARVRVVASQDNTAVSQTGGTKKTDGGGGAQDPADENSFTLNAGQYAEFEIELTQGGCWISADKPVAVASYLVGLTATGDPAIAWTPPIEQTIAGTAVAPLVPTGTTQMNEHHALIVTATATKDQTTVARGSGSAAALSGGSWTTGNGAGSAYSFYSLPLTYTSASYYLYNPNGLLVMGYGLGSAESYYYLAGASARNLDAAFYINDIHYQDIDGKTVCGSFDVRAVIQYAMSSASGRLQWYFNGMEDDSARDVLQWNKTLAPGVWLIEMKVTDVENVPHTVSTTITIKNYQATAATITTAGITIPLNTTADLAGASTGVTNPTFRWYASQTDATPLRTGPVFTTPQLNTTTTYYLSVEGSDHCENAPGDRKAVTVTVMDPSITVDPIEDLPGCITTNIPATAFSSPVNGVTFKWTNSNPAIGLAASGDGNQPEFTAAQTGSATITVTPYNNGVSGVPRTYTIKVSSCVLPVNPHLMIRYKE